MSTASFQSASALPSAWQAIVRRFVWKEYRVLRGLWLSVAAIGVLVDWLIGVLTPPPFDFASVFFGLALAATVLYTVGAAATTFSVEHEEETYGFLIGLPTAWRPVFLGKLMVAASTAAALAGVLIVAGFFVAGREMSNWRDATASLGVFGVAIVEALAWGTLFSLLMKRPLAAAALTIVVGTPVTQFAVGFSASVAAGFDPESYVDAIPLRLAIATIVLVCAARVAQRWLVIGTRPKSVDTPQTALLPFLRMYVAERTGWLRRFSMSGGRWPMTGRLLWQTWRQSWKRLAIPIVVGIGLTAAASIFVQLVRDSEAGLAILASAFFIPAMFGALAFSADQRGHSYRFLAEHAARPRYVWLARHVVWLGAVVTACIIIFGFFAGIFLYAMRVRYATLLDEGLVWGLREGLGPSSFDYEIYEGILTAAHVLGLAWWGALTAYAIGQFWSMLMRSEILAASASLVLAVVLAAWVAVLFVWQLASWTFLLPLFAGLMLATWLRAPAWITERRSWRAWLPAATAIGLSVCLVGMLLPVVRLAQLPISLHRNEGQQIKASAEIKNLLDWYRRGDSPEARETADMYLRAVGLLHSWENNDLLERWNKPEYMTAIGGEGQEPGVGGIDFSKIPVDERAEFRKAEYKQLELEAKAKEAAIKLASEASLRPTCRFNFKAGQAPPKKGTGSFHSDLTSSRTYFEVNELRNEVLLSRTDPDESFQPKLTALRMNAQIRSGQPSPIFVDLLKREQQILEQIGQWALHDERNHEQLREALEKLNEFFATSRIIPDEAIVADHLLVEEVLVGEAYPFALSDDPDDRPAYWAYLANRLDWERERGVRALGLITLQNMFNADNTARFLDDQSKQVPGMRPVRSMFQPNWGGWRPAWLLQQPAAATSYLTRYEYLARTRSFELQRAMFNAEVFRRATRLQLALALYRLDHKAYPTSLGQLVPNYLEVEPIDPYSGQPFQYAPVGLSLPLHIGDRRERDRIPPGTQMFWSVGPGSAQLRKETWTANTQEGLEEGAEPTGTTGEDSHCAAMMPAFGMIRRSFSRYRINRTSPLLVVSCPRVHPTPSFPLPLQPAKNNC